MERPMSGPADLAAAMGESPDHSSTESFEADDDGILHLSSAQWQMHGQASPSGTSSSPSQPTRVNPPMQKRRRVTRACDECRRKKIKCDGKQPCTHCTVYSYDCTYDQPSNRRRNPNPQYVEALESRLQRAEALLRNFIPNLDIKDPNFDSLLHQRQAVQGVGSANAELRRPDPINDGAQDGSKDAQLRSMIESTGQLDIDERGDWDFHGGSSGAVFLRRMKEQFGGLLGTDNKTPFLPRPPRPKSHFDSPRSMDSPYDSGLPNTVDLPPKETALKLCYCALNRACSLLRFVHPPTFYNMLDRIYDTPAEVFADAENRFLPLLYVVLALGCMFTEELQENARPEEADYKASIEQGFKYFSAGRQMMDITDCRDITSLQAILFMILFLQSSSNLSTCYSYIGIALRSALRMGMHRNLSGNFNLIEREIRRRVFWVIRKMDTYVAALLGFPRMLSAEDIDQELPIEVDDEFVTQDAILPMPPGKISVYAASNAHTRLMGILAKVIKYIYPIKGVERCVQATSSPSYVISHAKIKEVENDLQDWLDKLPMALRPGVDGPEDDVRVQQLLRMAFAHVQMMLYRPFLHYVSQKWSPGKSLDDRSYACAAAGVSVSRNIVRITSEMKRRGVLVGAYWFTMYTTFFAILSLVFFVLENPDKAGSQDILKDATAGKDALQGLARKSLAADRCNTALNVLFEKLPEKLKRSSMEPVMSKKKRSAASINPIVKHETRSSPDINNAPLATSNIQRATTFPTTIQNVTSSSRQTVSFDHPRHPGSLSGDPTAFRRSFHELMSPVDISGTGTPDSTGSSNNNINLGSQHFGPYPPPFGGGIPDLGAVMFPSADPFAYPNQPMMNFEAVEQKPVILSGNSGGNGGDASQPASMPPMYYGSMSNASPYDSLEGQIFGPLPPYLMHAGQPEAGMDMSPVEMNGGGGMAGLHGVDGRGGHHSHQQQQQQQQQHSGLSSGVGVNVNFDEIFAEGSEEWGNLMADQTYMQ